MKIFYLVASVICTVLILILAFENITASCSGLYFLFFNVESNPTIIFFGISLMGILTGALYHAFAIRALESPEEEEETTTF